VLGPRGGEALDEPTEVLDPDQLQRTVERTVERVVESHIYSGPLPHPEMLRQYEQALPGCGTAILEQWTKETAHRQGLEVKVVDSELQTTRRGQLFGFAVALLAMLIGAALIVLDKDVYGLIALLAPAGLLAGRFLFFRDDDDDDDDGQPQFEQMTRRQADDDPSTG